MTTTLSAAKVFAESFLDDLTTRAAASPRLRQHHNIHASFAEPCQRFFNAVEPGSYVRPSRQWPEPRDKLFVAVRGRFAVLLFDDAGQVTEVVRFGPEGSGDAVAVEIPGGRWNSVVSLDDGAVLLEVKAGPFDPNAPRDPAPWAPEEGGPDAAAYFAELQRIALAG